MISLIPRYTASFILLILMQVLILNNLHLSIFVNPYIYILFILILPFETPGWLVLSLAMITGLTMDAFSNTPGMHSASLVFMGFLRQYLLRIFAPRDGYESGQSPHYQYMGLTWFLIYAGILTFIHHFLLFYMEDFSTSQIFRNLLKVFLSSMLSMVIMIVLLLFSYKERR